MADSPKHLAKVSASVPIYQRSLHLSLDYQFVGSRRTIFNERVPSYGTANMTLFWSDFAPGLDLTLGVVNLFDRRYQDPATPSQSLLSSVEQDGRLIFLKAAFRF